MQRGGLFLLAGLLALWAALQPAAGKVFPEKPGTCPLYTNQCFGQRRDECYRDYQCRGQLKCCPGPCGRSCVIPGIDGQIQGRCPRPQQVGSCENRCGGKIQCPQGYGCCSNGCGRECMRLI